MYTKHHTEASVVKTIDTGEADRVYLLFTKELGMIYARAKSTRTISSKLRPALQVFSLVNMSLVKAHDSWRITNAQPQQNFFHILSSKPKNIVVASRVVQLVGRLVQGEEQDSGLYKIVLEGLFFLSRSSLSSDELENLEVLLVLRILQHLGYLGGGGYFAYLLASPYIDTIILSEAGRIRGRVLREINRSLRETQL